MRKLFISLFVLVATSAAAQMMPNLPNDPAYRIGKLDNGITYYIRHNEYPEKVANFYIAQRVGSIQEEDNQRGLAHFLEHMAFNGSTHFPENGIIEYTRSLGVAFGADLNAYTSIEQTVYNIDNVPTTRQSALDSCLLVLQDWSNGLELKAEEIDKERGVIHGEWSMRNSANQRLLEKSLPLLYPGNRYGERLPIGTMEVVDNFAPEALRAYYRKWYHPENQAIIVIGDIDVDYTEAKIKELFSGITAGEDAAHVVPLPVEDNTEAIYVSDKDKEMPRTVFSVFLKNDPVPRELRATPAVYGILFVNNLICSMFNSRMSELSQNPDCPFTAASMEYGEYLVSSTKDCYEFSASAKENKEREAYKALIREARRIKEFGFNGSEFFRAKEELMSRIEKQYSNRNKRKHTEYYRECLQNYLEGYAIPDADTEFQIWQMIAQNINVDIINQAIKELSIDNDTNFVAMCFGMEKDGVENLTSDDLRQIVAEARAEQLTAWVDNAKDEPLIAKLPKAGTIKKETKNDILGYTELQLSNGAKVILKKTDFKDDEVILSGWQNGGQSLYGEADYSNMKAVNAVVSTCGLGNFTNNELEKALAGKQASASISLSTRRDNVSGHSTPKDLETMFQLIYLNFTALQKDEKALNSLYQQLETALKNRDLNPDSEFSDSIRAALYSHNPRFANFTLADLPKVDADRCIAIMKERFANANNFKFVIIGNFDEQLVRQYACQYIASLPGKGKAAKTKDVRTFFDGEVNCDFNRKMETPKPVVLRYYKNDIKYNLRNDILSDYAGEILSNVLLKSIREDYGATYSVGAGTNISYTFPDEKTYALMQIYAPISVPEKTDSAAILMEDGLRQVSVSVEPDMLAKVKANFLKNADVAAKTNSYWSSIIDSYIEEGIDFYTDYKKEVEAVTPEMVSEFFRTYFLNAPSRLKLIMRPE